jgi:hypothetical protein
VQKAAQAIKEQLDKKLEGMGLKPDGTKTSDE